MRGGSEIRKDDVYEISGVIGDRYIDALLDVCQLNSFERLQAQVDDFMCEGMKAFGGGWSRFCHIFYVFCYIKLPIPKEGCKWHEI